MFLKTFLRKPCELAPEIENGGYCLELWLHIGHYFFLTSHMSSNWQIESVQAVQKKTSQELSTRKL